MGCVTQVGEQALQRRPHRLARRRVAGDGRRDDGRPPVWLVDAGRVQRRGGDPGRPPRRRRRRGRRVDVARADGLEPRRRRAGRASTRRSPSAGRSCRRASRPRRSRRSGTSPASSSTRTRSSRPCARSPRSTAASSSRRSCRSRSADGGTFAVDEAPRRDTSAERLADAQAGIHRGRSRHGRQLEPDRRRRCRDARRQRGAAGGSG